MARITKDETRKATFYRSGKWVIEIEDSVGAHGPALEMYIGLEDYSLRMCCNRMPLEQPHAMDGKTHYTREEVTEMLLSSFPDYTEEYLEEVGEDEEE